MKIEMMRSVGLTDEQYSEVSEYGSVVINGHEVFSVAQTDNDSVFAYICKKNGDLLFLKNNDQIDKLIESELIEESDVVDDNYCDSYAINLTYNKKMRSKILNYVKKNF